MRRSPRVVPVGILAVFAACQGVFAEPITTYPTDAYVMIKVNNLVKTSGTIGKLCEQWGIAALQPQAADPLGSLMKVAKIQQGIQKDGELGIAVLPGMGQPDVLVTIPVSDYKVFLANFPQATAEGEIHRFMMPDTGMQAFVTQSGSYALLSMNRSVLEKKPATASFSPVVAKEMAGRDIAVYVNFPSFRQNALQGMGMVKGLMQAQMAEKAAAAAGDRKALTPVISAAVGQYIAGFSRFITDTRALTYGISLSEAGIQATYVAEFEPNSYLAKLTADLKATSAPLITSLPEGKYLMVGGMMFDTPAYAKLIDDAARPIVTEAAKLGDQGKPIIDSISAMKDIANSARMYSFAASANTGKIGEAPLLSGVTVVQGDAKALLAAQRRMAESQAGLLEVMDTEGTNASIKTVLKPNAKTVGGVSFDEFTQTLAAKDAEGPEVAMQKLMYGPQGMTGHVGVIDAQTFLAVQSIDDAGLQKAVEAAQKKSSGALTSEIKTVAAKLPQSRIAEGYISMEQGATVISKFAETLMGSPLPIDIPAGQPPIGFSLSKQENAIQGDVYLPSAVVQNLIGAGMQLYMTQMLNNKNDGGL